MKKNKSFTLFIALTAIAAFSAGFVTAADHREAPLTKALEAVGQNLFGEDNFGVSVVSLPPPDDNIPAVQIDLASIPPPDDGHPVLFNVFDPAGASCVAQTQIAVTSEGVSVYSDDTGVVGIHFKPLGQLPEPCRDDNVIDPGSG